MREVSSHLRKAKKDQLKIESKKHPKKEKKVPKRERNKRKRSR